MGLFIVMTAAEYIDLSTGERLRDALPDDTSEPISSTSHTRVAPESGFRLRLPNGNVVTPTFPSGSLLVMNGEGSRLWIKVATSSNKEGATRWPYAPAHEVLVPNMDLDVGRAWFGRMYLPPRDAVLQPHEPQQHLESVKGIGKDLPSVVSFGGCYVCLGFGGCCVCLGALREGWAY